MISSFPRLIPQRFVTRLISYSLVTRRTAHSSLNRRYGRLKEPHLLHFRVCASSSRTAKVCATSSGRSATNPSMNSANNRQFLRLFRRYPSSQEGITTVPIFLTERPFQSQNPTTHPRSQRHGDGSEPRVASRKHRPVSDYLQEVLQRRDAGCREIRVHKYVSPLSRHRLSYSLSSTLLVLRS